MKSISTIKLLLLLLLYLQSSCTDLYVDNRAAISTALTLYVTLPATRSGGEYNVTYPATTEECQMNTLRLFAFPQDGEGEWINLPLSLPNIDMSNEQQACYEVKIGKGNYHIYVVANLDSETAVVRDESELKQILLKHKEGDSSWLPQAGNLPMIYESQGVVTITEQTTDITADLQFTCVKVKYNLIFDKTLYPETQLTFGSYGLRITAVNGKNLSVQSRLVRGGKYQLESDESEIPVFEQILERGQFYADYTRTDSNGSLAGEDVIESIGVPTEQPVSPAHKWLYQGVLYLPERYVAQNENQSFLTFDAEVTDEYGSVTGVKSTYKIALGHIKDGESATTPRVLPRSTYYEIIGVIKSLGNVELESYVKIAAWKNKLIEVELQHTTLWVSKTMGSVTSIQNDYLQYVTNAESISFGCDEEVDGKPLIVQSMHDGESSRIEFQINPAIPISQFGDGLYPPTGTTKVYIQANNLKKYIDVVYDVQPLFEVEPTEITIYWNESDATERMKIINYQTNLDGIAFPLGWSDVATGHISSVGTSDIRIACTNVTESVGIFTITATKDPITTTVHTFVVEPLASGYSHLARTIRVTVKPAVADYRIYFRAINDRQSGTSSSNEFQGILAEFTGTGGTNNNWNDGWDSGTWTNNINNGNHYTYIYSQLGETISGVVTDKVWYYNKSTSWPGDPMNGDSNNPGWYYYDLEFNKKGIIKAGNTAGDRYVKPGETLIIFSNNTNTQLGYTLHRCTHHLDPGISLFDYEDQEGWYLYDPTSDPYYRLYDDKPEIVDVNYIIYTHRPIVGWYRVYGVAENSTTPSKRFTIWRNSVTSTTEGSWYKTTIPLKAVKGDYEKDIQLKFSESEHITLFGGANYSQSNNVGYYDGANWHPGKP